MEKIIWRIFTFIFIPLWLIVVPIANLIYGDKPFTEFWNFILNGYLD